MMTIYKKDFYFKISKRELLKLYAQVKMWALKQHTFLSLLIPCLPENRFNVLTGPNYISYQNIILILSNISFP